VTTIDQLFDAPAFDEPEAPPALILDRSTAENYATCPLRGYLIERHAVSTGSELTDAGEECHRILSEAVKARHLDAARPGELYELIADLAAKSRPDVQPQVVDALRRARPVVNLLCYHGEGERAPDDILRYDGGEGQHAGQLAADLDVGGRAVRLTAELDLLMAGASPEELELTDWKSGWRHWTASDVRDAFQFQFYAWLVFHNYPRVNRVRVSVVMTRDGTATSPVEFDRREMYRIGQRLESAATVYLDHHAAADPMLVPAWPAPPKCATCDAAQQCHAAYGDAGDLSRDPETYLRATAAMDAELDRRRALLTAYVRRNGDLIFEDVAFGTEKPRAARAATCDLYTPPRGAKAKTVKLPTLDSGQTFDPSTSQEI
jgi:CRISPR/Cas system-associated exonuclease Cas4 (RecB family)